MSNKKALQFLSDVIRARLDAELKGKKMVFPEFPQNQTEESNFYKFVRKNKLSANETVILLLALVPQINPGFFNAIIADYFPNGGDFPDFGGVKGKNHRGILPTGETALFILAGNDFEQRAAVAKLFGEPSFLARNNVLHLEHPGDGEPLMSGKLILDEEYVELFTLGEISKPKLSSDFPAELISTPLTWDDLVLQQKTRDEIKEIETWLDYNDKLLNDWQLKAKIKPGFRVLFHGPSGTGKTITAFLLGKYTGRDVFRIDLSMVISKYIGETEKNLSKLFDKAENKDWILFFDEADSIFGKRTNVRDAHDKYANQEVSYLLQRIESHAGLVILASNMKTNIDPSFTRRFNSIVEFENPGPRERLSLWENYLPKKARLDKNIVLKQIARDYDLTGANIVNVIHYAGLQTFEKKSGVISKNDLVKGIQKEYAKEGKMMRLG
ncbi:ATPase family associated with various cellular activities (AAA) [Tangfeifania diversioriginum]|uniref:ATPase family associated with various cellular activities (AAA) n=1 Tax=Tangfeifania diversioriginum TaxID=1168035 RepID=A0A1M6CPC0_9BACT|nr:ATP-binding protein [Tangfeifania diversioriginum]SHI62905.1 ATPase family associated with various cellular activities (AAA) [Tangfeifania diversioriginum]